MIKNKPYFLIMLAAFALTTAACGKKDAQHSESVLIDESQSEDNKDSYEGADSSVAPSGGVSDDNDAAGQFSFDSTITDKGMIITENDRGSIGFMSGDHYGKPCKDADDALEAVYAIIDTLGGNSSTTLRHDLTAAMGGITYYTFVQTQGNEDSEEGVVKVAADQEGTVLGFMSSLRTDPFPEYSLFEPVDYQLRNDNTAFFDSLKPDTLTQTVEYGELGKKEITVPVAKDTDTGRTYLADTERKIVCVDYDDITSSGIMTVLEPGKDQYSDYELAYYDACLKVMEYYEARGWVLPNHHGSPMMLCIDRGTAGYPAPPSMAAYGSYYDGFEHMYLSARLPNEISISLLGHEFTHLVSQTNHVGEYMNETGAINESLSDIIGNAIEMSLDNTDESEWFDSFEINRFAPYPNYVWDEYYTPDAPFYTSDNDGGSVHHRSNCVSFISLRLSEAGMTPDEQFDFWIQADLALTPDTDFRQLGERLPWCMEIAGYPQYEEALYSAIEETGILDTSVPEEPLYGLGLVRFDYPDTEFSDSHALYISFDNLDGYNARDTWPEAETGKVASSLTPGIYYVYMRVASDDYESDPSQDTYYFYYPDSGWKKVTPEFIENMEYADSEIYIEAEGGKKLTLMTEGLP